MGMPDFSPVMVPRVVCTQCSKDMRTVIVSRADGKLTEIKLYCDTEKCRYAKSMSFQYVNAQEEKYTLPFPVPLLDPRDLRLRGDAATEVQESDAGPTPLMADSEVPNAS